MFQYRIIDKGGEVVFSNLTSSLQQVAESCPNTQSIIVPFNQKWRNGKIVDEQGTTYLITDEKELVESDEDFKKKIHLLHDFLRGFSAIRQEALQDALHDIQTLQAHNLQEIYKLVPYHIFFKDHREIIESLRGIIENRSRDTAYAIFNILKNSQAINGQLTTIRLNYGIPFPLQIQEHDIKKVFLNVYHKFDRDFYNKKIEIEINGGGFIAEVDYETFSAALIPIIENIVKYAAKSTTLKIDFISDELSKLVRFHTTSLKLDPGEEIKIFKKNYSGKNAEKFKLSGRGLGMYSAQQLLRQNNVEIKIVINNNPIEKFALDGIPYDDNILEIIFPF